MSRSRPTCGSTSAQTAIDQINSPIWIAESLLDRAEQAGDAAMPAYTHMQRAEPVLVAHWLLAYVEMFLRDADRLADCRKRLNLCPLGSGAVAGATLPLDRRPWPTNSASTPPPPTASTPPAIATSFSSSLQRSLLLALHLSRWAEEMIAVFDAGVSGSSRCLSVFDRKQRDAAEEESRPARADPRQGRPRSSATRPPCWSP